MPYSFFWRGPRVSTFSCYLISIVLTADIRMNTGMHDGCNLAWKLGGVLQGWLKEDVFQTYESERRTAAQRLIDLDGELSTLVSGRIPDTLNGTNASSDELLFRLFQQSIKFYIGIGIDFAPNILNVEASAGMVTAGKRGPDCLLRPPGSRFPLRLFNLTKNTGKFWVIVFAGQPLVTAASIRHLRAALDENDDLRRMKSQGVYQVLTVIASNANNADMALGVERFGDAYYDIDHSAHERYGISINRGAIVVLRPDGILGTAVNLDELQSIVQYFLAFVCPLSAL